MLKPRNELEKFLIRLFSNYDSTKEKQELYLKLESDYNIPISMSSDIISLRTDLSEYNEFILFAITNTVKESKVKEYFTAREIKTYSGQKLKENKIKFPIKLKMFEVTEDQWIGVSSAKFLMQLREAQFINYNAETQRALEVMLNNGKEIYRPSVDYPSVKEIEESYEDNSFIPNTISLNINPDDELADFEFKNDTLIIHNLTAFDIFDGYHRYLGMGRNYDKNNKFDYPIELRITNFPVSKAKQFIWQEDHKTKMKKVSAATYDQRNPGNMVIQRLNADTTFNLYNQINLSNGIIHYGYLAQIINLVYFNKQTKVDRKDIIHAAKELKDKINVFTEEYEEYLERKWLKYETYIIVYGLYNDINSEKIVKSIKDITPEHKKVLNDLVDFNLKQKNVLKEVLSNE